MPKSNRIVDDQLAVAAPIVEQAVKRMLCDFSEADREDAQQEILLTLWRRKLKCYDPRRGPLTPWLWRVIKRLAIDQLNKLTKRKPAQPVQENDLVAIDLTGIDKLALQLCTAPETVLKPKRAAELRDFQSAMNDAPDNAVNTLADRWNVTRNTADRRLLRLRESIREAVA